MALREFASLVYTRRADHRALVIAFFVVLPSQYVLIGLDWYVLASVPIPVHAFLLMAIFAAPRQRHQTLPRAPGRARTGSRRQGLGTLIEGHGGMLDRLDSVVLAAPMFFRSVRYWWEP